MTQEDDREFPQEKELREQAVKAEDGGNKAHLVKSIQIHSTGSSSLYALALWAALSLLTLDFSTGLKALLPSLAWYGMVAATAFLILRTGRVSRWRAVFFAVMAWAFVLNFKARSLGLSGSAFVAPDIQEVPYCHIAIASSFLNYVYYQYLAVMSGHWPRWGPLTLGVLWLVVTLTLGQAWCSWACFYGGLDETFSRLRRKPWLRWVHLPGNLRELPAAILLACALLSLTTLVPVFCLWACPLKLTTGFLDPNDAVRKIQLGMFILLGTLALVVGPLLTKKRIFCGLICPFGAWQAFVGRISPFRVTIQADRCNNCGLCLMSCPTFAIQGEGLPRPEITPYCNRCGECVFVCTRGAVGYTLAGCGTRDASLLFVFCALLVGGAVGGLFVPEAMLRVFRAARGLLP